MVRSAKSLLGICTLGLIACKAGHSSSDTISHKFAANKQGQLVQIFSQLDPASPGPVDQSWAREASPIQNSPASFLFSQVTGDPGSDYHQIRLFNSDSSGTGLALISPFDTDSFVYQGVFGAMGIPQVAYFNESAQATYHFLYGGSYQLSNYDGKQFQPLKTLLHDWKNPHPELCDGYPSSTAYLSLLNYDNPAFSPAQEYVSLQEQCTVYADYSHTVYRNDLLVLNRKTGEKSVEFMNVDEYAWITDSLIAANHAFDTNFQKTNDSFGLYLLNPKSGTKSLLRSDSARTWLVKPKNNKGFFNISHGSVFEYSASGTLVKEHRIQGFPCTDYSLGQVDISDDAQFLAITDLQCTDANNMKQLLLISLSSDTAVWNNSSLRNYGSIRFLGSENAWLLDQNVKVNGNPNSQIPSIDSPYILSADTLTLNKVEAKCPQTYEDSVFVQTALDGPESHFTLFYSCWSTQYMGEEQMAGQFEFE